MAITATDLAPTIVISQDGARGLTGSNGTNGSGFNNVRKSKIDNPLAHLFKKNKIDSLLSGALTTTRANAANSLNRNNLIVSSGVDTPREELGGWLIERASTNKWVRSQEFDNASWIKNGGATVSANAAVAPDGTTTADKFIPAAGVASSVSQSFLSTVATYEASVYVEKVGNVTDFVILFLAPFFTGGVAVSASFNLTTQAIVLTDVNSDVVAARIKNVGGNKFRVSLAVNISVATTSSVQLRYSLTGANGTTDGFNLWGGQAELGRRTSYIATTTAAATRNLDNISMPSLNNLSAAPLSIFCKIDGLTSFTGTNRYILSVPVSSGFFVLYALAGTNNIFFRYDDGATSTTVTTAFTVDTAINIIATVDSTNLNLTVDGTTNSTALTVAPAITTGSPTYLGSSTGTANHLDANIQDLRIYDFALNSDEITYLSGI